MRKSILHNRTLRSSPAGEPGPGGGGDPTPPAAPAETPTATPAPNVVPPAAKPAETPAETPADHNPGDGLPDDPAALKAEILKLRGENASSRTTAKAKAAEEAESALIQKLGRTLGLIKDDETLDPAKLTEQLTAAQTSQSEAARELSVFKTAASAGADASRLLDSRSFMTSISTIDPTDTTAIATAIGDALKNNPTFKSAQTAGASGVDHAGGSGEGQRSKTPLPMAEAVARSIASQH